MSFISRLTVNENVDALVVYDHYYAGGISYKGEISQLWGQEALSNAIRMWIGSASGEIIRQPQRGGYIRNILMKPMNEIDVEDIKMAIRNGFDQDFYPVMRIDNETFSIIPDYENHRWAIYLKLYSPELKIVTTISEEIKART